MRLEMVVTLFPFSSVSIPDLHPNLSTPSSPPGSLRFRCRNLGTWVKESLLFDVIASRAWFLDLRNDPLDVTL